LSRTNFRPLGNWTKKVWLVVFRTFVLCALGESRQKLSYLSILEVSVITESIETSKLQYLLQVIGQLYSRLPSSTWSILVWLVFDELHLNRLTGGYHTTCLDNFAPARFGVRYLYAVQVHSRYPSCSKRETHNMDCICPVSQVLDAGGDSRGGVRVYGHFRSPSGCFRLTGWISSYNIHYRPYYVIWKWRMSYV